MKLYKVLIILFTLLLFACHSVKTITDKTSVKNNLLTQQTQNLLNNLYKLPSKGFMFGHQDDPVYGVGWNQESGRSDVKSVVGDYPAVMGFDISKIELDKKNNIDGVPFDLMREEIVKQYQRGGVITLSWHMDNPLTNGDAWDVKTPGVVTSIFEDEKTHLKFISWLQKGADFIKTLKTADGTKIPVLFRPWHEHTGSWFWWGQNNCTKEEYIKLWKFTYDYFQKAGLNNLIWVYSPNSSPEFEKSCLERYPGDDMVDVLGLDAYQFFSKTNDGIDKYLKELNAALAYLTQLREVKHKPIALSETGLEGLPISDWWTKILYPAIEKYPISYVLVWRNAHDKANHFYAPYPNQKSAEDFMKFYNYPNVLFCKDTPDLYK